MKYKAEEFEPVEEMSAVEATRLLGRMCSESGCYIDCPIGKGKGKKTCQDFRKDNLEETLEILKQWKLNHARKPFETEKALYAVVMDENRNVVYEEKTSLTNSEHTQRKILEKYCSNHEGKFYALSEVRITVKE